MKQEEQEVYEIKRIEFLGRQRVPILMQGLFFCLRRLAWN